MNEHHWYSLTFHDFPSLTSHKPSPLHWYTFYLSLLHLDASRGTAFARRVVHTVHEILDDTLTTLTELILHGDLDTTKYQLQREIEKIDNFSLLSVNGVLHYAVISGNVEMVKYLLEMEPALVDNKEMVTKFSPFHYAMFCEQREMMHCLINYHAKVGEQDAYNATPFDYARMLGLVPMKTPSNFHFKVLPAGSTEIELWTISQFEDQFKVHYCPWVLCKNNYILELMFSGFHIEKDIEFREKYGKVMQEDTGESGLVLAWINEEVGWGVYAAKDYLPGDYIVRYGGMLEEEEKVESKSYNLMVSFEGYVLSALQHRNLGGMVNHSFFPNAETQCVFEKGAEQAILTAKEYIPKGKQILIDYSSSYWSEDQDEAEPSKVIEMASESAEGFPLFLPKSILQLLS